MSPQRVACPGAAFRRVLLSAAGWHNPVPPGTAPGTDCPRFPVKTRSAISIAGMAALLLALAAGQARADVTIRYTNPLAPEGEMTLATSGNRAAMRVPVGARDGRILYDRDGHRMLVVIDSDRSYMDVDTVLAALGGLSGLLAGLVEDMPGDLKSQLDGLLDSAGKAGGRAPEVSDTGQTDTVRGISCRVSIYRWPDSAAEMCLADPGEMGISAGDFSMLRAMVAKQEASVRLLGEILGLSVPDLGLDVIDRVPLRIRQLSGPDAGSGTEFLGISREVNPALVALPSDYRLVSLVEN